MTPTDFIPFHRPSIGEEEILEVERVLRSGWLTTGPKTAQFEREFREYVGAERALATNSGTAALHLALAALGVGPGDEVITTPLTFCATVNTILQVGAMPVLADIGCDANIDTRSISARVTSRSRAIIPVHLAGVPCDMEEIWRIAREHGLFVVEDAAHAIGSEYGNRKIGSGDSDAVAFSFYATKNLTTGEGGMVTTPNPSLFEAMKVLCLHGISKDAWNRYTNHGKWFYEVVTCGFKYNMPDLQAALGIHQLRKQDALVKIRTRYAQIYEELFAGMPELETPGKTSRAAGHAWHLYLIRLNLDHLDIGRDEFIEELHRRNIGASVHFIPISLHEYFRPYASLPQNHCPRALELYRRLISLPLYPAMTEEEVRTVGSAVQEIVCRNRKSKLVSTVARA